MRQVLILLTISPSDEIRWFQSSPCPAGKSEAGEVDKEQKVFELTEKKPQRSLSQNKYLHICLSYFGCQIGETMEYVKRNYYKILCNKDTFVREREDKFLGKIKYLRSSADLDSAEMSLTIERFRNFAGAQGIYIPSREEDRLVQWMEIETEQNKFYI